MKQRTSAGSDIHYYSQNLKQKMRVLVTSPAAIVEAPSGYGKTTAVWDQLEAATPQGADVFWFTAVEEAPVALYRRFCREIARIDTQAGESLLATGFPNAFTLGEACDIIRAIRSSHETWLVIDNFQCLSAVVPPPFWAALLEHGGDALHIILITQMLQRDLLSAIATWGIPHITAQDLRLETEDIRRYYSLAGVEITPAQAWRVKDVTDGWVIAVYLQLCAYKKTGDFSDTAIVQLMERLIWDKLTGEGQEFLLRLSYFPTVTTRQLCALLRCGELPEYAADCLNSPFIRYDAQQRRYEPHAILFELLMRERARRGEAFERECLKRAGDVCLEEGKTAEAAEFYARVNAYEALLSLDLSPLIYEEIGEGTFLEIALDVAQNCPADVRERHPLAMLCVAWAHKSWGKDGEFARLMAELDGLLPQTGLLRAEWLLLSVYLQYPQLDKMLPRAQEAEALFGAACSRVILPQAPWAFGGYYQLTEFHINAGEADREADALEAFIAVYSRLTQGHGSGADALFRAELAYNRCDIPGAEVFAYKALALAEDRRQCIIQLSAALTLADIAILKCDVQGWQNAISLMEKAASCGNQGVFFTRTVLDTVHGNLLVELGALERVAGWLKNGEFGPRLLTPMHTNGLYVHFMFLLKQGAFARLLGTIEALPPKLRRRSLYSDAIAWLLSAAADFVMGRRERAAAALERAAELMMPDGLVAFCAGFAPVFEEFLEELMEKKYGRFLLPFHEYKERYCCGQSVLLGVLTAGELPPNLTEREREVALLAAQGLRNREIAERLFVSENTVHAHLRVIFQKLDIDRRAKLAEKLK